MIQMHEVESGDHLIAAGDYRIAQRQDGTQYPVIVCPGCALLNGCSKHTLLTRSPLTIRASFLCSCGWHGWVTEGTMVEWSVNA
jgi:hypothetical protein